MPKACYIGFTGTPLLKKEKTTAARFGGFIHTYTMRQAVEDGAVVPLLYEGRMAELEVDQAAIDRWFERVTRDLTDEQKTRPQAQVQPRRRPSARPTSACAQIAYDISEHYRRNFQGTGFKAQLATSSKAMALKLQALPGRVWHGHLARWSSRRPTPARATRRSTTQTPELRGLLEAHDGALRQRRRPTTREIIADFRRADGVEMLIVVDKLLVGFDEPRNTVLYIDKPLKEHGLLQAIARVNRLFEGKDFGYIVDYRGVLGELNEAMETYNALEGFDPEDVAGTITDVSAEIAQLPQLHSELWAVFKTVPNKQDREALQQFLAPEDVRQRFYDALTAYARTLKVALSAVSFYEETPERRSRPTSATCAFSTTCGSRSSSATPRRSTTRLRGQGAQAARQPHPLRRGRDGGGSRQHL